MIFKAKILVVEDDTAMLRLLGEVLTQMGAEPYLLASSVRAAELVNREKFDGVFLDWRMPELDGLELARRIRQSELNPTVPIVMLTGVTSLTGLRESFEAGINFFLQKPVSIDKLRRLLNASRGAMLQERRRYRRAPAALWVRCRWDKQEATGASTDLGPTGMSLILREPPREGTKVEVEFELPGERRRLRLAGVVTHVSPGSALGKSEGQAVGLEFRQLKKEDRSLLSDYVGKTLAELPPTV
ncbi:MAG: response regulator [Terriglobia bacterium]